MSMAEVAQATVTIIPNMKGSQEKIAKELSGVDGKAAGTKISASLGTSLLSGVRKHAKAIGGILAGVGVAKFASSCVDSFTSLASSTKGLQRVIGGTAEQVSGLMGAMKLSGMDVDKANTSLTIFSKKLEAVQGDAGKTAEMSKTLGTSIFDATGHIRPMSELLPEVADKFAGMQDGAEKTALACQLFGKSGTAMLPFLNKGSAGVAELTAKAKELGIVIDDAAMSKFSAYRSAIREWDTALQGAKVTLGQSFTPFIVMATKALSDTFVPVIQFASGAVSSFLNGMVDTVSAGNIAPAIEGWASAFASAFTTENADAARGFGEAIGHAVNGAAPIIEAATPLFGAFGSAVKFVSDNATWAVPAIVTVAGAFVALKAAGGIAGSVTAIGSAVGRIAAKAAPAAAGTTALAVAERAQGAAAAGSVGQTLAMGAAILMIGGGVALAGAGLMLMASGAVSLASAGAGAVIVMVGMAGALVGLAAGLVVAGPALIAAAPGAIAFGAAVLMIGAGIGVASAGMALLSSQLPVMATYGIAAGSAATMLGAGLLVMGTGALVAGAGMMVLGAGLLVAAPGLLLASASAMILGAGMLLVGAGATMAAPAMLVMATALPTISASAAPAAAGLGMLAGAALAAVPGLAAGAGPAAALSAAIVPMGSAAILAAAGLSMVCATLPTIASDGPLAGDGMRRLSQAMADATPALSDAAPIMAMAAASVTTMATGTMLGAASMMSLASGAQNAASSMVLLDASMLSVSATATRAFATVTSVVTESFAKAVSTASSACASINRSISSLKGKTIRVNVDRGDVKLPHFSMSGAFNAQTGQVPRVDVSWYARGTIFKRPTIFGGIGEDVTEAAMPLEGRHMRPFAHAVAMEMPQGRDQVVYNVTINARDGADGYKIARDFERGLKMQQNMGGQP